MTRAISVSLAIVASTVVCAGESTGPARAEDDVAVAAACAQDVAAGLPLIAAQRTDRFLGKARETHVRCNGGDRAVAQMAAPWVDWSNYWATGDAGSKSNRFDTGIPVLDRNKHAINGALIDLEYQRMELIKFNLFDNKTFEQYLTGKVDGKTVDGATIKVWKEMRLPADHPAFRNLKVEADGTQTCSGDLIRFRTLSGICNDIRNPAMGSTGQLFARNVEFESTFPDLARNDIARNRHGGRLSLLQPDPQVISRKLFTRDQSRSPNCNDGHGVADAGKSDCAYKKAPFFNVLAAFWIQFMTHDWFSHLDEARNDRSRIMTSLGCASERVDNVARPISPARARELGCRPDDKMEAALIADATDPTSFNVDVGGRTVARLARAYKTTRNNTTAWWDASQIYGYDEPSRRRVRRDPADPAKLAMQPVAGRTGTGDRYGYLPEFRAACGPGVIDGACDPIQPEWVGQEATAFPDNWSLDLSFFHNLFVREHNIIVDALRDKARREPKTDSGLRHPDRPSRTITYGELSNDELFEIARLVVAAEIAKIHTIEWTPQLLYDEPLYIGMNANWSGLFAHDPILSDITKTIVTALAKSPRAKEANELYSAFAAGSGIVGRGSSHHLLPDLLSGWLPDWVPRWLNPDMWSIANADDINGGVNHFGSPFNFPEEFVSVYRLHPMVPDLLEYRDLADPNVVRSKLPVIDTFRGKATAKMHEGGLANWALTMGRQRLGLLLLQNQPAFLQNLDLRPRLDTTIDLAALDIIRDRERGVPRFNEFRRQIGLRQLTKFDDFIDRHLPEGSADLADQRALVNAIREVYGQHRCDASKQITTAQRDKDGSPINDCLGQPDGSMVDNIEDVDIVVGFLAETTRPHGYAISETQFHIFIINASRRLFSDRFLTSSFRPEFYTQLGYDWVMHNGPTRQQEAGAPNGHAQDVLPLKRVLLRAMPELEGELQHVVNAFDPWARERGEYYTLDWKPRPDAVGDASFGRAVGGAAAAP
jgi:heme peroxidase